MLKFLLYLFISLLPLATFASNKEQTGMVVSEQLLASQIGANILRSGGNAIDAAVAVGYALAVVNPCCGNIGGGGFMTIHLANGKNVFINFREKAPLAATPTMFLNKKGHIIPNKSTIGYLAVAIPGTVMGLNTALKKYGTLPLSQLIAPSISLAKEGFKLMPGDTKLLDDNFKNFQKHPNVANIFLKNGRSYKTGERLIQTDLANTLQQIAKQGSVVFYQGKIADKIVQSSRQHGGILSKKDFATYDVEELSPIICYYRGYKIISAPPPSSGGTALCEMLNILENFSLQKNRFDSAQSVHYVVEAMRFAYADRNEKLGDPNFVTNPVQHLISKKYAKFLAARIPKNKALKSIELDTTPEGLHTTHYSIIDKKGNAVAVTYTLNSFFGAQVIADHTGFILNDEMDDFSAKPGAKNQFGLVQGAKNAIQPGKRPLSSMTPTIITKNNRIVLIIGSPGGPRIITSTLLTILNVIDYGMTIQEAVNKARYHHQWLPDTIEIEPLALSSHTINRLLKMGYHFSLKKPWGAVEAIYIDPVTHRVFGANDKRRSAGAAVSLRDRVRRPSFSKG